MKKLIALVLAGVMALSLVACGSSSSSSAAASSEAASSEATETESTGKANSDITIAYVVGSLTNQIFADQVAEMERYSKEIGVNFMYTGCEDNNAKITACENYIQMGVDCLICHVSTAEAMMDTMKAAQDAGIIFFAYDTAIEGCDLFFGWDNYDYGQAIGANACNWINETFSEDETCYCYSAGYKSADFLVVRESGYVDYINENAKCNIEWVGEADGGSTANGVTAGENWLQMGKPINLVVGINDAGVMGVCEAFKAAGMDGTDEKLALFAGDAITDCLNEMCSENSMYRGTVLTGLVNYADMFIDLAIDAVNGGEGHWYYGGLWFITPENVQAYVDSGLDSSTLEVYSEYYINDPA